MVRVCRRVQPARSTCNILFYLWTCVTGKLRYYSSQPTFTSMRRKTRLSSAFSVYSASRPRSRL
ncbi:hypothetical protein BYT27DRAFT_7186071 [Phlegmacium glaucopus]|nr:hypothetical protein BYT27DRAFT_7186071 [Phlegmacium glaucopus]